MADHPIGVARRDFPENLPYGLGGSVFTDDIEGGKRITAQIDMSKVLINHPIGTAPELPFGGVKRSGYGRELFGLGIEEFVNKSLIRGVTSTTRSSRARCQSCPILSPTGGRYGNVQFVNSRYELCRKGFGRIEVDSRHNRRGGCRWIGASSV